MFKKLLIVSAVAAFMLALFLYLVLPYLLVLSIPMTIVNISLGLVCYLWVCGVAAYLSREKQLAVQDTPTSPINMV